MKYAKLLTVLMLAGLSFGILSAYRFTEGPGNENVSSEKSNGSGYAVLELFTSEGCSSCPPADELMAKIQNEYKDQPVYLLVFHVDYWDKLGWKDAFSNSDYTSRQKEYGAWLNLQSIYTPQLIVNGKSEFVGSDEPKIRKSITEALSNDAKTGISIQTKQDDNKLTLNYQVVGAANRSRLLTALVQKSAKTKVERGENSGRLLSHVQIVRSLQSEPLAHDGKGATKITLPKEFNSRDWEVIAMIQELSKGGVLTAIRIKL